MSSLASYYQSKERCYFSAEREQLAELVDRKGLRVLDVGCGAGNTGKMLRDTGKASWVTGIELVPEMGEIARASLDEVRIGNVEDMEFEWEPGCFDCFLLGDVLEHIYNPWRLLRRLRPFLAADGIVVASIPNVRHWPVIAGLVLHDDWPYTDCGVLDITHLRFFTRRTAMRMFSETGYAVQIVQPYFNSRRYSIPNSFTFGVLAGFFSVGWLMRLQAA